MSDVKKPHPMDVPRHLECGRKLTPILCGWSCKCGAVFVSATVDGVEARVLVREGKG